MSSKKKIVFSQLECLKFAASDKVIVFGANFKKEEPEKKEFRNEKLMVV